MIYLWFQYTHFQCIIDIITSNKKVYINCYEYAWSSFIFYQLSRLILSFRMFCLLYELGLVSVLWMEIRNLHDWWNTSISDYIFLSHKAPDISEHVNMANESRLYFSANRSWVLSSAKLRDFELINVEAKVGLSMHRCVCCHYSPNTLYIWYLGPSFSF